MKVIYILFALLLSLALLLTSFELTLLLFHSPFNSTTMESEAHSMTWVYLLEQNYMAFIDLDIFTIHEKRHLLDVKRLFENIYSIWAIVSTSALSLLLFLYITDKNILFLVFRYNFLIGLTILLLFIFMMTNFLDTFSLLHRLIFPSDSWIFSDDSILIDWFPLSYFQEFIVIMLSIYLLSLFTSNKYQPNLSTLR